MHRHAMTKAPPVSLLPRGGRKAVERHPQRINDLLGALPCIEHGLIRVILHGDTHGLNSPICTDAAGQKLGVSAYSFFEAHPACGWPQ